MGSLAETCRLAPNARIAVVGGGPAGSFFALAALRIAAERNLPLLITVFERKDLTASGPRGCNMCAGILSTRVVEGLARLDIHLPTEVIRGRITRYQLHWRDHSASVDPPTPDRRVLSVYRAGGPRASPFPPAVGFDEFLLKQVQARGARVVHERVDRISFEPLPRVHTSQRQEEFDLVVLAIGVNATPPVMPSLHYVHPATEMMAQDSLLLEEPSRRVQMESTVHVFFDQPRDLIFGALVPKGEFATVSLLGHRLHRDSLQNFLTVPEVTRVVGVQPAQLCGCRPHVAVAPARIFYDHRFVAVGDSCVTRLYKDGIGSALITANAAATTALLHGVGRADFAAHYAPICRAIARDNRVGRIVFAMVAKSKRNVLFMRGLKRALDSEATASNPDSVLSKTLWMLFTGDANYSEIFRMLLNLRSMAKLGNGIAREIVEHTRDQ